ncbi:MAG: phage major capsid protein [Clostridia bacterium]|nr:phage major capsid protein [Clostridia bacterium]
MLSVEALDDVLKSFYLEVVSSQINCGASPLYDKIEKSSVNVNGKNAIVPIYYGINGSLLSTNDDGATLPESCPTMRATLEVPLRNVYGVIDVTDKALRLTKDNVDGVIDVLGTEIQAMINSARHSLNRMLWTDGLGYLGTVSVINEDDDMVFGVDDVRLFIPGMKVDIYRGGTKIYAGKRIASVFPDNSEIGFTTFIPPESNLRVGDRIYACNSVNTELQGLPYLFAEDDDIYFGQSKMENYGLQPAQRDLGEELTLDAMQDFMDYLETHGDVTPDLIVCSKDVRRKYLSHLQANRANIDYLNLDGGFRTLSFNGIPLYGERFCPSGDMYFLNTNAIKMVQLNDWEWLEGANGSILNRMDNKAAYQAVLAKYCNYVSTMPSSQGRLFNIA